MVDDEIMDDLVAPTETDSADAKRKSGLSEKEQKILIESLGQPMADRIMDEAIVSILCRYNYPHNPIDETIFLLGIPKDLPENDLEKRKKDYRKIRKYLIRQTFSDDKENETRVK